MQAPRGKDFPKDNMEQVSVYHPEIKSEFWFLSNGLEHVFLQYKTKKNNCSAKTAQMPTLKILFLVISSVFTYFE